MTAGDEEAAGEPVTDLTCEWGGVGGMGAVEGASTGSSWLAACGSPECAARQNEHVSNGSDA